MISVAVRSGLAPSYSTLLAGYTTQSQTDERVAVRSLDVRIVAVRSLAVRIVAVRSLAVRIVAVRSLAVRII